MTRRFLLVLVLVSLVAVPVFANHSWGTYHWARTSNPFTLKVHDNVTSNWEPYLSTAASDWNSSSVMNLTVLWQSPLTSARKCGSTSGQIEVCNTTYGQNGWLGIAGISITSPDHINKGYTKLNDTYFNMAQYNTPAYRQFVVCQEIGHDFGLGHVNETFTDANTGSCMDYTNDPDGGAGGASSNDPNNMHPNQHDYDLLVSKYSHLDSFTTISMVFDNQIEALSRPLTEGEILNNAPEEWGTAVRFDANGKPNMFVKIVPNHEGEHFGLEIIDVFWAPEDPFEGQETGRGDRNK
jgi:hypothetical protein